jgi:putative membrane protein
VTGAAYGALAEFYPAAANRDGVSFGMTLMALTAESAAPSNSNVNKLPLGDGNREQASRIASHVVFGVVAETTRRTVRKML